MFKKFIASMLNKDNSKKLEPVKLEEQLERLGEFGITLNQGMTVDDLLISFPRQSYESEPYQLLLTMLGGEKEEEPYERISDHIIYLDTECIENKGDYVKIAEMIDKLTGGELGLKDLEDEIETASGKARLSFKIEDKSYEWHATVNDDWLDPHILTKFAQLFLERGMEGRLCCHYFEGQDQLLLYIKPEQLDKLNQLTKLKFNWLE